MAPDPAPLSGIGPADRIGPVAPLPPVRPVRRPRTDDEESPPDSRDVDPDGAGRGGRAPGDRHLPEDRRYVPPGVPDEEDRRGGRIDRYA